MQKGCESERAHSPFYVDIVIMLLQRPAST